MWSISVRGEHKMTSNDRKKINIFFDTNILEVRYGGEMLMYSEYKLPNNYSKLSDFIKNNDLKDYVELCIPEVVWNEITQHMRETFSSQKQSAQSKIENYKKSFGDLADISCNFKINGDDEYEKHLEKLSMVFWKGDGMECKLISYPKSTDVIEKLINKAFKKERPFVAAKAINGGKPYSDAGLKDALIVETILAHCNNDDTIGILFSNDGDFSTVFSSDMKNRYKVFNKVEDIIDFLEMLYNLNDKKQVQLKFENDNYLKDIVVNESGNTYDKSVTDFIVDNVSPSEDENIFIVKISATINETRYLYEVKYDFAANAIIESKYTLYND